MFRTAVAGCLRAARQTAAKGSYVAIVSSATKQASVQPKVAMPTLNFVRGFAAAAEPAPAQSASEGTVVQVRSGAARMAAPRAGRPVSRGRQPCIVLIRRQRIPLDA